VPSSNILIKETVHAACLSVVKSSAGDKVNESPD
jgi:hypothetical protein